MSSISRARALQVAIQTSHPTPVGFASALVPLCVDSHAPIYARLLGNIDTIALTRMTDQTNQAVDSDPLTLQVPHEERDRRQRFS